MSECTWLSDRMPAVALGRAEWTPDEIHHLSGCQSCQREWELVRITSRLGEGLLPEFTGPESSGALLRRLGRAGEKTGRRRAWGFMGLAAAAAIAAFLWGDRGTVVPRTPPTSVVAGVHIPLPELEGLQPAELDSVLRTMDEPSGDDAALEAPELGDLDSDELQTVLELWEG